MDDDGGSPSDGPSDEDDDDLDVDVNSVPRKHTKANTGIAESAP